MKKRTKKTHDGNNVFAGFLAFTATVGKRKNTMRNTQQNNRSVTTVEISQWGQMRSNLVFDDSLSHLVEPPNSQLNKAVRVRQLHKQSSAVSPRCILCNRGGVTLTEQVILRCAVSRAQIEYLPEAYGWRFL